MWKIIGNKAGEKELQEKFRGQKQGCCLLVSLKWVAVESRRL